MGKDKLALLSMNLLAAASLNRLSLYVLVERTSSGYFMASVPELPNCLAEAETRSDAIAAVQEEVRARIANVEVLTLEISNNPWTNFIGMFEGDDEFAKLAQELRAEREMDINSVA